MSGHTSSIVLPHEPVDSSSQQEINRDVTTVHWNVRKTQGGMQYFIVVWLLLFGKFRLTRYMEGLNYVSVTFAFCCVKS